MGDGKRIANVADIVKKQPGQKVVVLSAMSGVTDKLINIANKLVGLPTTVVEREVDKFYREIVIQHRDAIEEAVTDRKILGEAIQELIDLIDQLKVALLGIGYLEELSPKSLDYVQSFGERSSVLILAATLNSIGVKAEDLTGHEAGLITDSNFGCAHPLDKESRREVRKRLSALLKKGVVPVITGFIAADKDSRITTLGRGGSDFTASIIGAYLNVKEVQIWTDVDGILTTDPGIVKNAKLIPTLSYIEAMDLAYFGANVIHSKMIEPAMNANVPVRVKNTFRPNAKGTRIVKRQKTIKGIIKSVTLARNVALINLQGVGMAGTPNIAGKIFSTLGSNGINIIMISGSSESNLSFVVSKKDLKGCIDLLTKQLQGNSVRNICIVDDISIITVVGAGMRGAKGIAAKVFDTISKAKVNIIMIAQGSSEVNISFVVRERDAKRTVKALHKKFVR